MCAVKSVLNDQFILECRKHVPTYRTVKNFGGENTVANLANHHNLPSFFANFYLVQCHVVWCSQPIMHPLNNKRGASPVRMKAAAALHGLSITTWIRLFYTS